MVRWQKGTARCGLMRRRLLSAVTLVLAWSLHACAIPQDAETRILEREGGQAVRALRYAGRDSNPIDDLWIRLDRAPAFRLRFPDGTWVNSREIDAAMLRAHGLRFEPVGKGQYAVWRADLPAHESLVGRHQYLSFHLDEQERVIGLDVGACGRSFDTLFATADGISTFGFPIPVAAFETLFGPPTRVERLAIITGFSCW